MLLLAAIIAAVIPDPAERDSAAPAPRPECDATLPPYAELTTQLQDLKAWASSGHPARLLTADDLALPSSATACGNQDSELLTLQIEKFTDSMERVMAELIASIEAEHARDDSIE